MTGTPAYAATRALVVFVRAPERGQVKTRLAASIGADAALAAYRMLGTHVARNVVPLSASTPPCTLIVAYTPDSPTAEASTRTWLGDAFTYEAQVAGDLGARMAAAISARVAAGADAVVVIGADCPAVSAATVERAFAALDGGADVVFGPAADGGYYLVALRRVYPELFTDVPWSSSHTLAVTLHRARSAGRRITFLDTEHDVDTAVEWDAWRGVGAR
jgi:rSAM/selenodomain-associated transferase 1